MPEPQLAGPVVDHDEMVAFGGREVTESSWPACRGQDTQVAGAVERGEQQQASRRLGEPLDPAWYSVLTSQLEPTLKAERP